MKFTELDRIIKKESRGYFGEQITGQDEIKRLRTEFRVQIEDAEAAYVESRLDRFRERRVSDETPYNQKKAKLAELARRSKIRFQESVDGNFGVLRGPLIDISYFKVQGKSEDQDRFFIKPDKGNLNGFSSLDGIIFPIVSIKRHPPVVQELLPSVSLDTYLEKSSDAEEQEAVARNIGEALAQLHNAGYSYKQDIYESVMIDSKGNCRFINLGKLEPIPDDKSVKYVNKSNIRKARDLRGLLDYTKRRREGKNGLSEKVLSPQLQEVISGSYLDNITNRRETESHLHSVGLLERYSP